MLKKLRLDLTKEYETCVAAYEIAKMLVAFAEGREHISSIGAEQGDIKTWDDFIIEEVDGPLTHIQVKRQQTDFSPEKNCKREAEEPLSPLDESIKNLGIWVLKPQLPGQPSRKFMLYLPGTDIEVKTGLKLRQLKDFLALHVKKTSTVEGLENLHKTDATAAKIFQWLTTWCGFTGWEHILKALQLLKVKDCGTETDLNSLALDELRHTYADADSVLSLIKSYIQDNSAYTAEIAPRQLSNELKNYKISGQKTWTQIEHNGAAWKISGTHDLEHNHEIERAEKIVPLLWAGTGTRQLRINAPGIDRSPQQPFAEIFRLAVHGGGAFSTVCVNWHAWKEFITAKVGYTLGTSENDCDNLNIEDDCTPFKVANPRILAKISEQEKFAQELNEEMIKTTWSLIETKVQAMIGNMENRESTGLRDAVETRWGEWQAQLKTDLPAQIKLFSAMLHPPAEDRSIFTNLRIGVKTAGLLAKGLFFLACVSVALSGSNPGVESAGNNMKVSCIGLGFWSGPSSAVKRVREIDDPETFAELIGGEAAEIVIIPKSRFSESYLRGDSLASGNSKNHSLAERKTPYTIVTDDENFRLLIKNGELNPLKVYLQTVIDKKLQSIKDSIKAMQI